MRAAMLAFCLVGGGCSLFSSASPPCNAGDELAIARAQVQESLVACHGDAELCAESDRRIAEKYRPLRLEAARCR